MYDRLWDTAVSCSPPWIDGASSTNTDSETTSAVHVAALHTFALSNASPSLTSSNYYAVPNTGVDQNYYAIPSPGVDQNYYAMPNALTVPTLNAFFTDLSSVKYATSNSVDR